MWNSAATSPPPRVPSYSECHDNGLVQAAESWPYSAGLIAMTVDVAPQGGTRERPAFEDTDPCAKKQGNDSLRNHRRYCASHSVKGTSSLCVEVIPRLETCGHFSRKRKDQSAWMRSKLHEASVAAASTHTSTHTHTTKNTDDQTIGDAIFFEREARSPFGLPSIPPSPDDGTALFRLS